MGTNTDKVIEDAQREMTARRREVMGVFKKYEKIVKDRLGDITREAHKLYEEKETVTDLKEKMTLKVNKMKELKDKVEQCLKHLNDDESEETQASASKGMERRPSLEKQWEEMDPKLESILENAALDDKGKDFDLLENKYKMCLLCLSIFPVNAKIAKRVLISWWIGEGFVTPTEQKTAEEVGEETFKYLLEREFIQPVYNKRSGVIVKCRMHPWIQWMLISRAREIGFFEIDKTGMPSSSLSKENHACLVSNSDDGRNNPSPYNPDEGVKTLFNVNVKYLDLGIDAFSKMKKIVVLQLGSWIASPEHHTEHSPEHHIEMEPEVLERLSNLISLRYLSLRGISLIETLPESIQKLQNLTILDLRGCQSLKKLPKGITKLKKLARLDVSECYMLESMPKGLSSLTELQVLKGFVISRRRKAGRIIELSKLPKLKKLSIIIGSQVKKNQDLEDLGHMKGLCSLTVIWSDLPKTIPGYQEHEVDMIQIPPELEKLDLRCYPRSDMPTWLMPKGLRNLKRLYIRGGKLESLKLKEKEQGNEKWKIKVLRLKFLRRLMMAWSDIDFQSLNHLEISECQKLPEEIQSRIGTDHVWTRIEDTEAPETTTTPSQPTATSTADSTSTQTAHSSTPESPPEVAIPASDAKPSQTPDATAPSTPPNLPASTAETSGTTLPFSSSTPPPSEISPADNTTTPIAATESRPASAFATTTMIPPASATSGTTTHASTSTQASDHEDEPGYDLSSSAASTVSQLVDPKSTALDGVAVSASGASLASEPTEILHVPPRTSDPTPNTPTPPASPPTNATSSPPTSVPAPPGTHAAANNPSLASPSVQTPDHEEESAHDLSASSASTVPHFINPNTSAPDVVPLSACSASLASEPTETMQGRPQFSDRTPTSIPDVPSSSTTTTDGPSMSAPTPLS